jgi:serine phosphatase RsbU (regulator of sigma subunit)
MPEAQYSEQAVDLESGDLLLFYSDGLTEAQNKDGAFFDEQRLIDFLTRFPSLTAGTTGERLLIELDRFVGEANVHDDVSLVIMKKE